MDLNEINKLRLDILRMFGKIDPLIKEKFSNVCNKTSQYKVPDALFQNRTDRKNRVLLPFKSIINNNITVENLSDFSGGLCVEFVNDDYFNEEYRKTEQFRFLSALIGGNGIISSIISFRTEEGDPGATIPRQCWEEYITEEPDSTFSITDINGQNLKLIPITRNQEVIDKIKARGSGLHIGRGTNELWKGNAFWEIKGGDQTSIQSHATNAREALFNPATDFANEIVTLDITITMSFFAMHCYDLQQAVESIEELNVLKNQAATYLKSRVYDEGNLLDYCKNHDSLVLSKDGYLIDPIQFKKMSIYWFRDKEGDNEANNGHSEAAVFDKFHFDSKNNFLLSAARPTNFFWLTKLSNMVQQNFTLDEFWKQLEEWRDRRETLLKTIKS